MPDSGSAPNKTYIRTDGTRTGAAVNVQAKAAAVNNTAVLADSRENDIAEALNNRLMRDGGNQPSAALPMNGYNHTNVGVATARTHYARASQAQDSSLIYGGTAGGTANAITLDLSPSITAYVAAQMFLFKASADNTDDDVTVNIDGVGDATLFKFDGATKPAVGDIQNGGSYIIIHDGANFCLVGAIGENLNGLANLTAAADRLAYFTGANGAMALATFTAAGRALVDDADAAAQRTTLGLGTMAVETAANYLTKSDNLNSVASKPTARTNLGIAAAPMLSGLTIANNSGTPNTQIDLDTTGVSVLVDTDGAGLAVAAADITINAATTGANGLDAGSLANSTWYHVWLISNGSVTSGLLSTSATAPTMPSGYTYKARCGAVRTGGSATFLRTLQKGNRTQYRVIAASTTPNLPVMASGNTGSVTTPTWTAVAVGDYVPPTAVRIMGVAGTLQTGGGHITIVAPNNAYGPHNSASNPPPFKHNGADNNMWHNTQFDFMLESTDIYYAATGGLASNPYVCAMGWTDAVNAS